MFESHVTVEMDKDEFIRICQKQKIKAIVIENDTASNNKCQLMTGKFHKTSYEQSIQELHLIASYFPNVIRRKLELVLGKVIPNNIDYKYQEIHSKFIVPKEKIDFFVEQVLLYEGHTSVNSMKSDEFRFVTTRNFEKHQILINQVKLNFELVGTIREYVIFDDNPNLDSNWHCFDCFMKAM